MKTLKKIFYGYLTIQISYWGYLLYNKGYKFDANDSESSLQIILRITDPLERGQFLREFNNACEYPPRCINLHGMTKKEIYNISKKIRGN